MLPVIAVGLLASCRGDSRSTPSPADTAETLISARGPVDTVRDTGSAITERVQAAREVSDAETPGAAGAGMNLTDHNATRPGGAASRHASASESQAATQGPTASVDSSGAQSIAGAEATRLRLYVGAHLQRSNATSQGPRSRTALIDWIRKLGFVGTRIGFEWIALEPRQGQFDWAHQDSVVDATVAAGIRAYGLIVYSPSWARPAGTGGKHRPVVDGSAARGDTAFAHFAATVARRYRGKIQAWELWNEPNIPNFWADERGGQDRGPDPLDYFRLYRLAHDSIRAAVPTVIVMPAGLSSGPRRMPPPLDRRRQPAGYPAAGYLDALLSAGLRPAVIALHPYTVEPIGVDSNGRPVNPIVSSVEAVLDEHGLKKTRLWITEWGVNAREVHDPAELEQWYRRGLHALVCDPRLAVVTIFDLTNMGEKGRFALLDRDGNPTENGVAMDSVLTQWKACP